MAVFETSSYVIVLSYKLSRTLIIIIYNIICILIIIIIIVIVKIS